MIERSIKNDIKMYQIKIKKKYLVQIKIKEL